MNIDCISLKNFIKLYNSKKIKLLKRRNNYSIRKWMYHSNVRSIRPGYGMHPKYLKNILGKIAKRDYKLGDRLRIIGEL